MAAFATVRQAASYSNGTWLPKSLLGEVREAAASNLRCHPIHLSKSEAEAHVQQAEYRKQWLDRDMLTFSTVFTMIARLLSPFANSAPVYTLFQPQLQDLQKTMFTCPFGPPELILDAHPEPQTQRPLAKLGSLNTARRGLSPRAQHLLWPWTAEAMSLFVFTEGCH